MGGRCDDSCDNRSGRGFNPADPRDLARELDNGNARTVLEALQRDAYTMQPRQFEQTVRELARIEDPRYGDNLRVRQNGEIELNRADGQIRCIGNIYRQEDMAAAYARRHDGNYAREIPREPRFDPRFEPEPYYHPGQDPRHDPRFRYPGTPPFFPDERHGRNGRVIDPRFDPRYDPRYDDRGRYNNGQLGQEIIRDGVVGAIVGRGSGGDALKGAGINILLNQVFRPRGY